MYRYDSSGNVVGYKLGERRFWVDNYTPSYDDQSRLVNGLGQAFGWQADGRLDSFAGAVLGYGPDHLHAVRTGAGQVR